MFYCFVLLPLLTWAIVSATARYYVVLRLAPNTTELHGTSAQFKLFQPNNSSRVWDCRSGSNPIVYRSGPDHVISAKSIDLELGAEVECLGLSVRVVVGEAVSVWGGQESDECQECSGECPGFITSTTELERSDSETTLQFLLTPTTVFQVYSTRPNETCARRQAQYVTPPSVAFSYNNNTVTTCYVLSGQLRALSCNMTITTGGQDVIATATTATQIQIPRFIWQLKIRTIQCSCSCRITQNESKSEARIVKQAFLSYTPLRDNTTTVMTSEPYGSSEPHNIFLFGLCIVSLLLLLSTIAAIFFMNLSRQLNKRLRRLGVPGRPPPSFSPDQCSGIHSIRNECHHYNTVSLRLSDCVELEGRQTLETYDIPIYQKLNHAEDT